MSEHIEQCAFAWWLETQGLKFTAIPNSTFTKSYKQKAKNKKEGLRRGLPDMFIIANGKCLWVEMKYGYNKPTKYQKSWLNALEKLDNNYTAVCYTAEEAIDFVKSHLRN